MLSYEDGQKIHLRSHPAWADDFKIYRRLLIKYTPSIGIYHLCHSVNLINAINVVFLPVQEELQACITAPRVNRAMGTSIRHSQSETSRSIWFFVQEVIEL